MTFFHFSVFLSFFCVILSKKKNQEKKINKNNNCELRIQIKIPKYTNYYFSIICNYIGLSILKTKYTRQIEETKTE